jgi:hypothetical protein
MNTKLTGISVPAGASVDIHIHVTAPVNITPYVARQNVNVFVIMKISSQLCAEAPDLVGGERLCWSVPVMLGFPDRGIIGKVGEILVDASTGELLIDKEKIQRISDEADRLAEHSLLTPA